MRLLGYDGHSGGRTLRTGADASPRFEHGSPIGGGNTEMLGNVTLFADISNRMVAGVETNFRQVLDGSSTLLVMPQVHDEVDRHWMIRAGVGGRVINDLTLPEIGFRPILSNKDTCLWSPMFNSSIRAGSQEFLLSPLTPTAYVVLQQQGGLGHV